MHVTLFQRRPTEDCHSLEANVRCLLPPLRQLCDVTVATMPQFSKGVLPRVKNMWAARRAQSDVNHITGDVHYAAALMDSRRTVLTIHDCEVLHRTSGLRRNIIKFFWYTLPARRVSRITVVSGATKEELLRHVQFPADRIHVIPTIVDSRYQYVPREFDGDCPVILQVGTRHNKNLERVIAALQGFRARLVIVGALTCDQRELLHSSEITFENHVNISNDSLRSLYESCDIVTFVSIHEGFGMPIVEAQRVGRPVLTSNCSSMPEVAGDGALLVDPLNVSEIRNAIERIVDDADLRQQFVSVGQENAKRFDAAEIARQYFDLYQLLA